MTRTSREISASAQSGLDPRHPNQSSATTVAIDSQQLRLRRGRLVAVTLFLVFSLVALLAVSASAQGAKYDVLPVEEAIDANLEQVQREARAYATARDISSIPANRVAAVERYFRQYIPAKLTQPDAMYQINDVMSHATASLQAAVRMQSPASRNIMRWMYGGLKPVAMGNYQPAGRINAIHFIAHLEVPGQRGALPRPYPFVLTDMKQIYDDANNPDGVRAAALKGLERYVRFTPTDQIDDATRQQLTQSMTDLLQQDPPKGRQELAHAFLQRYAVSILTNLSTDASIAKQLVSVSTKDSNPNLIALHSAAAVGTLPGKMAEGDVETKDVLKQWSARLLSAYESEVARLEAMEKTARASRQPPAPETFLKETKDANEKKNPRGTGRSMEMDYEMGMDDDMMSGMEEMMGTDAMMDEMMGGMGGMMSGMMPGMTVEPTQPAEIVASRQKLNFVLQQLLLGVTGSSKKVEDVDTIQPNAGLLAATPAAGRDSVKKWVQSVNDLATNLNDTSIGTRRQFVKMLGEQLESLETMASGKNANVKAYQPPALDELFNPGGPAGPAPPQDGSAQPAAQPGAGSEAGLDALMKEMAQ